MFKINDFFSMLTTFIILCILIYNCDSKDYCRPQFCNNSKQHVLCKFQSPGKSRNCLEYEKLIKNEKERQQVLDKINSRRNKVASGEIRSLPTAANIVKLVWNSELETFAQRWADQCLKSSYHDSSDTCRDLENIPVSQNIATIFGESPGLTITSLIDTWYMELLNINISILPHYLPSSTKELRYDYFTQLIWANTNQVGCGGVKFMEINTDSHKYQNRTVHRMVCNFAPAGNRIGQSVYNFGSPCSQCNYGNNCDSEYKFLCPSLSAIILSKFESEEKTEYEHLLHYMSSDKLNTSTHLTKVPKLLLNEEDILLIPELAENNDTKYDFFADLFETTGTSLLQKDKTTKCKELLPVDEFIELLRNRLRNDNLLKDLLLSTTRLPPTEPVFSDRTIAAIVNQLYSKKEAATTSKSTENDNLNSTILVDLVEAVIFRHTGKYPSAENIKISTQSAPDVRPVKIQAELAEVKSNKEFTGHYFFPEDDGQTDQETTDLYDESENLPISDIGIEIQDLKRNSATKDFLEEILESDFNTDSTMRYNILSTQQNLNGININSMYNNSWSNIHNSTLNKSKRLKRYKNYYDTINYYDLLKKLAHDLRVLKLPEKFNCAHNSVKTFNNIFFYFMVLALYSLCLN